jgi:hypothetical protein
VNKNKMPLTVELAIEARRERQRVQIKRQARSVGGHGAPATVKQLRLLRDLRDDFGLPHEGMGSLSVWEARDEIRGLLHRRDQRRAARNRRRRAVKPATAP